jgi:hypothetical protein
LLSSGSGCQPRWGQDCCSAGRAQNESIMGRSVASFNYETAQLISIKYFILRSLWEFAENLTSIRVRNITLTLHKALTKFCRFSQK